MGRMPGPEVNGGRNGQIYLVGRPRTHEKTPGVPPGAACGAGGFSVSRGLPLPVHFLPAPMIQTDPLKSR